MLKQSNGARGSSSVVECHLAKVDVASSNLVYRSILISFLRKADFLFYPKFFIQAI